MSKLITKYKRVKCSHCREENRYIVKFYLELQKRVEHDGSVTKKLVKRYIKPAPQLCSRCEKYKRCAGCEIIICDLVGHSNHKSENPELCNSCIGWESRIKNHCICGNRIKGNLKKRYKQYGNFCDRCMDYIKNIIRKKTKPVLLSVQK